MNKRSKVMFFCACLLVTFTITTFHHQAFAQGKKRPMPPRSQMSWEEIVAKRQAQYAANPKAFNVPVIQETNTKVIAANETDPIEGLLVEWWCSAGEYGPDPADQLWIGTIATATQVGADAYVYLYNWDPSLSDAVVYERCSNWLYYSGVDMNKVHLYQNFATDSFWIRDFGPLFVRDIDTNDLSLEDAKYYPGSPLSDTRPRDFAARIGKPVSDFNLYLEGGNFLPNGGGICIVSSVVRDANPHIKKDILREMFRIELGCEELVIVETLKDASTGHVDMWMAWANHTTLLVGEYTLEQDPVNRQIIERNVRKKLSTLVDPETGIPIDIVRIPMPSNCPLDSPPQPNQTEPPPGTAPQWCPGVLAEDRIWRNYLNVAIMNGVVLLPTYAQDRTYEEEALYIWQSQGFYVVPIDADLVIPYGGAFHCVVKTIDAPQ